MAQYSAALRMAWLAATNNVLGSAARFVLYDGPVPPFPEATSSDNNELATLSMSAAPIAAPSGLPGQDVTAAANNMLPDTDAAATGRATFWRIVDSSGQAHVQGTAGINDDADLILNSPDIQIHAAVAVTGPVLILPA